MKASDMIIYLQSIINTYGDCNIYKWNDYKMIHELIDNPLYMTLNQYNKKLGENCKEYKEDFEKIVGNIII